jgi:hypothetical protein
MFLPDCNHSLVRVGYEMVGDRALFLRSSTLPIRLVQVHKSTDADQFKTSRHSTIDAAHLRKGYEPLLQFIPEH